MASKKEEKAGFIPLYSRVVVKRDTPKQKSAGGILLPDNAVSVPDTGVVVSVGAGKVNDRGEIFPLAVKVGDHVKLGAYAATEIRINGEALLIMEEEGILGILN